MKIECEVGTLEVNRLADIRLKSRTLKHYSVKQGGRVIGYVRDEPAGSGFQAYMRSRARVTSDDGMTGFPALASAAVWIAFSKDKRDRENRKETALWSIMNRVDELVRFNNAWVLGKQKENIETVLKEMRPELEKAIKAYGELK